MINIRRAFHVSSRHEVLNHGRHKVLSLLGVSPVLRARGNQPVHDVELQQ